MKLIQISDKLKKMLPQNMALVKQIRYFEGQNFQYRFFGGDCPRVSGICHGQALRSARLLLLL